MFKDDLPTLRSLKTRRRGRGYAEACSARVKAGKRRSGPSPYHVTIRIIKIHKARLAHSHFSTPRAAHHIFIDALECTHASRGTPYATRCIDFGAHLSVPGHGYPTVSAKIHTYVYTYVCTPFLPPFSPSIRGQKGSCCGASSSSVIPCMKYHPPFIIIRIDLIYNDI